MNIEVRFRGVESSAALREHARRAGLLHLGRFGREVVSVVLRIADVNGPKGGVDKRCLATVTGPRIGACAIEEHSGDFYSAVEMAVERVAETVGRMLQRVRCARRRRLARPERGVQS